MKEVACCVQRAGGGGVIASGGAAQSLYDICTDESGVVDFSRTSGLSMGKTVKMFVSALNRAAEAKGGAMFTFEVGRVSARV